MRSALAFFAILAVTATPAAAAEPGSNTAARVQEVQIERSGDQWTADFTFKVGSPVWVFPRSALARVEKRPWRELSWTVETPGVKLKRLGFYDALVATGGNVPRKVRVRFMPYARDILADYDPALAFTDGSVALFTEHYNAIPVASEDRAAKLPSDLNGVELPNGEPASITFRDRPGDVLFEGRRHKQLTMAEGNGYVLFGKASVASGPAIATILDPQLPAWIAAKLNSFTPALLDFYGSRLGPRSGSKPTVIVSWAGPTPNLRSLGGSVLPNLIIMRLEGDSVIAPNKQVDDDAHWFIAHESAHFWAGQTVRYSSGSEAWITEGAADLFATHAVDALVPGYDAKAKLQSSLDECLQLAARPISTAAERSEHRAYYACGTMFGLAADAAARRHGGDIFSFWRGLIQANKTDEEVNRAEWLSELTRLSGSARSAEIIGELLDKGAVNPTDQIAALFEASGVAHHKSSDGKLLLQ